MILSVDGLRADVVARTRFRTSRAWRSRGLHLVVAHVARPASRESHSGEPLRRPQNRDRKAFMSLPGAYPGEVIREPFTAQ